MSVEEAILEKVRVLPPEKQREVLDFASFLQTQPGAKQPLLSMKGLCAGLGVSLSAEDIDEVRREMWKNFPRDNI